MIEPRHPAAFLAVLLTAPFLAQVDATIANVAIPTIHTDLGASDGAAELVVGGYLVAYAVLLITGARLGQTHGYKRMFLLGVSAFALTSLGDGLAPNATLLVIMRVAQGAGAALMFPQALTGIQMNFTGDQRARAIGLFAIALSSGAVIGQVLGGALVSADIAGSGWRVIFLINVPICLAVIAAASRFLPADEPHGRVRVDLLGVAALSTCVALVIVPLTLGRGQGWPMWTWACLVAGVPAFWLFVSVQRRTAAAGRAPLVNISVIAHRRISLALVSLLVSGGTYFALLFTLAQYFQVGLGRSALASGLALVPWVAAFGLAGQIAQRLPGQLAPALSTAGYLLLTAAYVGISIALFAGRPGDLLLTVLLAAGGLGLGIVFTTLTGHLTNAVRTRYAADISGVSATAGQIGGAIGVAAFGSLYLALASAHPTSAATARHSFAITTLALAAAAAIGTFTAYLSTHARAQDEHAAQPARRPVHLATIRETP